MDPLQKIVLKQEYDIDQEWAFSAYVAVCSRLEPLTASEAKSIGPDTCTQIANAREMLGTWGRARLPEVKKVVFKVFEVMGPPPENRWNNFLNAMKLP